MDETAYIGEIVAGLVCLFVGVRLYRLSRRTRQLPETLIAASFLLWVFGYAVWDIPYALADSEEQIPAAYSYASLIAFALGDVLFAIFTRAVFRPGVRWAMWLVVVIAVSYFAGIAGTAWVGDWEGIDPLANPWYWLELFGGVAPSVWMGAEGLARYLKTRRQLALGLCNPMTCNRFLLWAIAGSLWAILEGVVTASDLVYAYTGQWSESLGLAIALFEIVPVAMAWCVFFPPDFYCRWVEGSANSADAAPTPAD
jgi:hypothetical protein